MAVGTRQSGREGELLHSAMQLCGVFAFSNVVLHHYQAPMCTGLDSIVYDRGGNFAAVWLRDLRLVICCVVLHVAMCRNAFHCVCCLLSGLALDRVLCPISSC